MQCCTFRIDGRLYGIDVLHVQEILRRQPITPVPLAHGSVEGLINLRGQIVTAIDLRHRLNLPPRAAGTPSVNVVVRLAAGTVSLVVDEIGDVLELPEADFEPTPDTVSAQVRPFLKGVSKLTGHLLLLLDPERAADLAA
ncbi:MAG: Chemotaxis protein CheW [Planctomycetota bacterium]|jgi:purine-binding chemotaxis protein CheW